MAGQESVKEKTHFFHLKEFNGLEMLRATYCNQVFSRHVHETFCIGVIEEGAQRFHRKGTEYIAPKGDIILVNADEIHTGSSAVQTGWSYQAIYPSLELLRSLSRDFQYENGSIPWFPSAVVHDPGLSEQLRMTFNLLAQNGNTLFKETMLLSSLAWLVMRYGQTYIAEQTLSDSEKQIFLTKEYIDSHPENDISLNQLADMVQLSPWHFLRQFKKAIGVTPHIYLILARLRMARRLLTEGDSILNVALRCGFSDQSHFNRHFKNALGITPGKFVRSLKESH
ncbi:AraC family transcriptional regulator [Xenorhabdus szentirmaii]|uniref:Arabinose operon regulatory protein n=2 Tax=Xenorhabdus szentirmaii TaxID=290112 RepID=W1J3A8_9GAMM|nr:MULTISPECIES: AraC family transcriptional regulator [Xenorhabdus]MBD2779614.1 AraC family transcriptional regulator [Xenorhabdus sp. 38]MBD2791664.1 AraC family transcriptional regulator [Xenorhabdus sp. CUL]MBD2802553.1 AraC family transcriptional regulator [Xenorhabdus sp. M]MBD2804770.1 AraC family transcriptional regulator [Xenorhabdus sp. ZM]MBD2822547.1 AraC family transcriptional regulator [Xenorhabdus sp. 42]